MLDSCLKIRLACTLYFWMVSRFIFGLGTFLQTPLVCHFTNDIVCVFQVSKLQLVNNEYDMKGVFEDFETIRGQLDMYSLIYSTVERRNDRINYSSSLCTVRV